MVEIEDQPDPVPNGERPLWEMVVEDMVERDRVGRERYGTPLQAGNGRDAVVDAYQEALDLVVYLRQVIEEGRPPVAPRGMRLVIISENLIGAFGTRTFDGRVLSAEWGHQAPEGWYEVVLHTRDDGKGIFDREDVERMRVALEQDRSVLAEAQEIMRRLGYVIDRWPPVDAPSGAVWTSASLSELDAETRWQGLAFTLYTALIEISERAKHVLEEE